MTHSRSHHYQGYPTQILFQLINFQKTVENEPKVDSRQKLRPPTFLYQDLLPSTFINYSSNRPLSTWLYNLNPTKQKVGMLNLEK